MKKIRVLVFIGHYCPGYKSGGILRSVLNSVDTLGDEFEFLIVTRNIDVGERESYRNITVDKWKNLGKASVYYLDYRRITFFKICELIKNTKCDIIHLNSFFEVISIKANLAIKYKLSLDTPVILSPRGEFADASFKIKFFKKRLFVLFARFLGIYSNVVWHVSSKYEMLDLQEKMKVDENSVELAMDLPNPAKILPLEHASILSDNHLRVVFLSRISEEKNLDIAISILGRVTQDIVFHIYGMVESHAYWEKCQNMMKKLPKNIKTKYCGPVQPKEAVMVFSKYDLFLFPSGGENYGHVIAESLSAGTKVLVSNNTPWRNLQEVGLGWDFDISNENDFVDAIKVLSDTNIGERIKERGRIIEESRKVIFSVDTLNDNKKLYRARRVN